MSTTFDVFPTTDTIPSFRQLLDVASAYLDDFLRSYGITRPAPLTVTLRHGQPDHPITPFDPDAPAWWPDDSYAWFHVPGIPGGTDAYACPMDDAGRGSLDDINDKNLPDFTDLTTAALQIGHYWSFRRSAGQPAIINIAYGLLAGALAELTDGFVFSTDGAWDYSRLPAHPDVFLSNYFRPELNRNWNNYDWTKDCISRLPGELSKVTSGPVP